MSDPRTAPFAFEQFAQEDNAPGAWSECVVDYADYKFALAPRQGVQIEGGGVLFAVGATDLVYLTADGRHCTLPAKGPSALMACLEAFEKEAEQREIQEPENERDRIFRQYGGA